MHAGYELAEGTAAEGILLAVHTVTHAGAGLKAYIKVSISMPHALRAPQRCSGSEKFYGIDERVATPLRIESPRPCRFSHRAGAGSRKTNG